MHVYFLIATLLLPNGNQVYVSDERHGPYPTEEACYNARVPRITALTVDLLPTGVHVIGSGCLRVSTSMKPTV